MGVPRSSKETRIIDFCPEPLTHLSGCVGLSGFVQNGDLSKIFGKWVSVLVDFDVFAKKGLSVLTNLSFLK